MENTFCRHLNLKFGPSLNDFKKSKTYSLMNLSKQSMVYLQPDRTLVEFLKTIDLTCRTARVFYTPSYSNLPIHVDNIEETTNIKNSKDNQYSNTVKINWVFGAKNSTMSWWRPNDVEDAITISKTPVGSTYLAFDENKCTKIWSENITDPCLLNVGQPHSVENTTGEDRWCMSFVLDYIDRNRTLTWDDACSMLKDHFK